MMGALYELVEAVSAYMPLYTILNLAVAYLCRIALVDNFLANQTVCHAFHNPVATTIGHGTCSTIHICGR